MAGIAAHLIIAREIQKLLPKGTIKEEGMFYAGSIAPDAIHAREGFVREDKRHTHLRDDIRDMEFLKEENLALFHQRVTDFILTSRKKEGGVLDLYRGYVVHILTDELYMRTLRYEFVETMKTLGISQSDREFFHRIVEDMTRNDYLLMSNYKEMAEIRAKLENVKSYEIKNMLSEQELTNSRNWVIQKYFVEKHDCLNPIYISYERTLEFIELASRDIVERLSEGGSLTRMF
ncbi:hypothetical protein I5677_11575 [Mobilitalea sibirica]|uniref:Phospholipase C/D domain-containing protein n=1 Tax=Mobilitalea sibirica TaxID=1462919 RepID=A0A8J7H4R1_9FIRM|nr:hypothetical protein [Mobilitalea sibirica]MBH1941534.1 hypothetical protein [Mobilitalea sibirica]